jgi:chromosome segregation ATPase
MLENKAMNMERAVVEVRPEKIRELNDRLDHINSILQSKDNIIDQLLNEIAIAKSEKDEKQNEVMFKKQRIDTLNMEFNTKELEYQRLWTEGQDLKAEIRGDTADC